MRPTRLELNGFTPLVLSDLGEISISHAYRILEGTRMPSVGVAERLAGLVGMSLDEFIKDLRRRQRAA